MKIKIGKRKSIYFAVDQRLVRRHKIVSLFTISFQAIAVLLVMVSYVIPNLGSGVYAASGAYTGPHGSDVFVMLVDTSKPGDTSDTQFQIRDSGDIGFNYSVDCDDDGIFEAVGRTSTYTCNYETPGIYSVVIDGSFHRVFYNGSDEGEKILEVQQWGGQVWSSFGSAFYGASNLQVTAIDAPNLSSVTNMSAMFSDATSFNSDISSWDVSNVTNMSALFQRATSFNQPLGGWDTSSVTNMSNLFNFASSFDQNISNWDVSNVIELNQVFAYAIEFNQPLNDWDTSSAHTMNAMFDHATVFNQPLGSWNTSSVNNMYGMFSWAQSFNQDISTWNTSDVTDMSYMLNYAQSFNQDISTWNTANVTNVSYMLQSASMFNHDLGQFNMSSVANAASMFNSSGINLETYDSILSGWSSQALQNNVAFGAQGKFYCAAAIARQNIIDNFNWTINDAGQACTPEIVTGGVVSVSEDSAEVEIDIFDDGGSAIQDAGVQYGLDINYNQSSNAPVLQEGLQAINIQSLSCETIYHYRAYVQTIAGTVYGDDAVFITADCPKPPDLKLDITLNAPGLIQGQNASYTFITSNVGEGPDNSGEYNIFIAAPNGVSLTNPQYEDEDTEHEYPYFTDGETYLCNDYTSQVTSLPSIQGYLGTFYICNITASTGTMESGAIHSITLPFSVNGPVGSATVMHAAVIDGSGEESDTQALDSAIEGDQAYFTLAVNNIAIYTGVAAGSTLDAGTQVSVDTPGLTNASNNNLAQTGQNQALLYSLVALSTLPAICYWWLRRSRSSC